jgi:hypothetical protein
MSFAAEPCTRVHHPFEARKGGHLRAREFHNVPHPEVRALASLEGPLTTSFYVELQQTLGAL